MDDSTLKIDEDGEHARLLPERIGPYRVLGLLGEGGMGRVYLAHESHPPRDVALKVMRGLSGNSLARFRREVELLAQLEHPGIARLYAAGEDMIGGLPLPWLALELIRGHDLRDWVERNRPDLAARLKLLIALCRAVQHAHERGVIHRDLKPGNILVDADGQPKILDFGVARLHDTNEGMTQAGQVLGTVPYMSPEQLAGRNAEVGARSDVYALGVIAYELVSGSLPHPRLSTSTLFEALDIVRREEPAPLHNLAPQARGDLDKVVMKALATEPSQRYATAGELADDLQRLTDHRPVLARPPTLAYRAGRFVRRHRALSAAAAIVFIALVSATAISTLAAQRARAALAQAEARAAELKEVNEFVEHMLTQADPEHAQGRELRVRDILEVAAAELATSNLPAESVARLRQVLGVTWLGLGEAARSQSVFDAALAQEGLSATLHDELLLGRARSAILAGDYDTGEQVLRNLRESGSTLGPLQRIVMEQSEVELLRERGKQKEAVAALHDLLPRARELLGADDQRSLGLQLQLSSALQLDGDYAQALEVVRDATARHARVFGPDHPQTLYAWDQLGIVENKLGHTEAAEAAFRRSAEGRLAVLGESHPATVMSQLNLGSFLIEHGRTEEGVPLVRHTSAWLQANRPEGDDKTLVALNILAYGLEDLGDLDGAEQLLRELLAAQEQRGGPGAPDTFAPRNNLAMLLMKRGRPGEALSEFETLEAQARAGLGDDHPFAAIFASNRALALLRSGRAAEARKVLEPAFDTLLARMGADHARTRTAAERLGEVYDALGLQEQALALREKYPATE